MTAEPTPRTDAERMVKVPWEPTSEMIQAMENRQIEGATYIAEDSIQYALWKEVWKAALTVAEAEREGKANDSVPGMDIVIREIERARLHGPDLRTLDALDITLARAKAAEADFIQVHKNCIEARQRAEAAERELALAQSRLAEVEKNDARWRTFRSLPWYEAMYEIADAAPDSNPEYPACRDEAIDEAIKRSSAPSQS